MDKPGVVHTIKVKSSNMKKFLSEPLFQFFVLGAILYLTVSFVQSRREKNLREIVVDRERVALLINNYKTQTGTLPTRQQLDAIIDNYIKEEISFREAKKMGLDKEDEIVRRRLSQKFDFVRSDLAEPQPPTDAELREFYEDHPSLFRTAGSVNFSHIFFSTDNCDDRAAKQRALSVLQLLRRSSLQRDPGRGDRFALQYDYTDQTELDIRENFGDKPIVDSLFTSKTKEWIGPVQSGYGWHLLYISKRSEDSEMPYDANKDVVRTKYMEVAKEAANKKAYQELSKNYVVKRTYLVKQ